MIKSTWKDWISWISVFLFLVLCFICLLLRAGRIEPKTENETSLDPISGNDFTLVSRVDSLEAIIKAFTILATRNDATLIRLLTVYWNQHKKDRWNLELYMKLYCDSNLIKIKPFTEVRFTIPSHDGE